MKVKIHRKKNCSFLYNIRRPKFKIHKYETRSLVLYIQEDCYLNLIKQGKRR